MASLTALPVRGCGKQYRGRQTSDGVTKVMHSRSVLERRAVEGKSPVREMHHPPTVLPSSSGTVQTGVNLRGPPRKAKYNQATDSELVP